MFFRSSLPVWFVTLPFTEGEIRNLVPITTGTLHFHHWIFIAAPEGPPLLGEVPDEA
jgi:hypothetical protein